MPSFNEITQEYYLELADLHKIINPDVKGFDIKTNRRIKSVFKIFNRVDEGLSAHYNTSIDKYLTGSELSAYYTYIAPLVKYSSRKQSNGFVPIFSEASAVFVAALVCAVENDDFLKKLKRKSTNHALALLQNELLIKMNPYLFSFIKKVTSIREDYFDHKLFTETATVSPGRTEKSKRYKVQEEKYKKIRSDIEAVFHSDIGVSVIEVVYKDDNGKECLENAPGLDGCGLVLANLMSMLAKVIYAYQSIVEIEDEPTRKLYELLEKLSLIPYEEKRGILGDLEKYIDIALQDAQCRIDRYEKILTDPERYTTNKYSDQEFDYATEYKLNKIDQSILGDNEDKLRHSGYKYYIEPLGLSKDEMQDLISEQIKMDINAKSYEIMEEELRGCSHR